MLVYQKGRQTAKMNLFLHIKWHQNKIPFKDLKIAPQKGVFTPTPSITYVY